MVQSISYLALVYVVVSICDRPVLEISIKLSFLYLLWSVSYPSAYSLITLKLALVHLAFIYLSTMMMFESILELSDILRRIGDQYSVAMQLIVFALADIPYSVLILILHFL